MKKYILLLTFIAIACAAIAHADRDDDESNRSGIFLQCKRKCPPLFICIKGKCRCLHPRRLINGHCVLRQCRKRCPPSFVCYRGKCRCLRPLKLINGRCVLPIPTCPIRCPPYYKCLWGRCFCPRPRVERYGRCVLSGCHLGCHKYASCKNNRCKCNPGYFGDGRLICIKLARCRPRCRYGKKCKLVHGRPLCVCPRGYRSYGRGCRKH